jgi:hypothetical protein
MPHTPDFVADAYIEWGGQYDHRTVELDEWQDVWQWTDMGQTDALDLGKRVGSCFSLEEAKEKLEMAVFVIGEPSTYIHYSDGQVIKKKDYLLPTEKKFLRNTGIDPDLKPDFSNGNYRSAPTPDAEFLKSRGIVGNKKVADVPSNLHKPSAPVSKEYDAVKWIYDQFTEYQIDALSWKDFQKRFQQFAAKYSTLFTEIRHNGPQITADDLKKWLQEVQPGESNYELEYDTYGEESEHSYRDVKQLVVQLNQGAAAQEILSEDPFIAEYVRMVGQSSEHSGHPANELTVGWLRVDFINEDWLLVDEIQSDLVNSVSQAKAIISAPTFEALIDSVESEIIKAQIVEKVSPQQFAYVKRHLVTHGYTEARLEQIKTKLIDLFKDWAEYGLASLLEIARKHFIKNVAVHTAESIALRDKSVEADKIKIYYDNLARSMGFRKQTLDVGELKGNFWVRTASESPKTPSKKIDWNKDYPAVRSDPRQVSLLGPDHEDELRNMYAKPKTLKSKLFQDTGIDGNQ